MSPTKHAAFLLLLLCATGSARAEIISDTEMILRLETLMKPAIDHLKPARRAFEGGDLRRCRTLLGEVTENSKMLPHPDVQLALWFFNAGMTSEGIRTMEKVAETESNRSDVRYLFAEIARSQGRLFDAWTHLKAAETAAPRERWSQEYIDHLNVLLLETKARTADARKNWEVSKQLFSELNKTARSSSQCDLALGRAEFNLGNIAAAEKHFVTASQRSEANIIPVMAMAELFNASGDLEATEEYFKRGATLAAPSNAEFVRLEYVGWLLRQNRSEDARAQATQYRPSEKRVQRFEYMIALADRMKGDFPSAEKTLAKLHQAEMSNFQYSNQLALVLIESKDEGKRGRALQLAQGNVRANPKSKDAISTFAWIAHRLGDSRKAEQFFMAILRGGQASRDTAFYVSRVKAALGKPEEAALLLKAAQTSKGEFFNAFRSRKDERSLKP